jgi:quinolinate synthase
VQIDYADAYLTAHLEVPGALFHLGLEAQRTGRGVVGSTSDILGFVGRTVDAAVAKGDKAHLRFVLGTETGMVTSLVRRIESALVADEAGLIEVEIVFPVAETAVTATDQPAAGEGCSVEGGCATCPYMKMNSLDALLSLLEQLGQDESKLLDYAPRIRTGSLAGRPIIDWATEPIQHMRAFSRDGKLPDALVADVLSRGK